MNPNGSAPLHAPEDSELHLRDFLYLVRRNLLLIGSIAAVVIAATGWYTWRTAPVYQAQSTIHVDTERESVMPGLELLDNVLDGANVETEMALLRARHIAEAVVDSLALQVRLVRPVSTSRDSLFTEVSASDITLEERYTLTLESDEYVVEDASGQEVTRLPFGEARIFNGVRLVVATAPTGGHPPEIQLVTRERPDAIEDLQSSLDVGRPFREANLISVRYQGTDPAMVQGVPNTAARTFIQQRIVAKRTEAVSMVQFLNDQLDTYRLQLQDAEDALQAFQEGQQIVNLEAEGAQQVARMVSYQADRDELQADLNTLNGILADIDRAQANQDEGGPSPFMRLAGFGTFLENQAVTQLLSDLTRLNNELEAELELRERAHPDVIALERQVAQVEDQLNQLAVSYQNNLRNELSSVDNRLSEFGAQLQRIPEKGLQEARLDRRKRSLEVVYDQLNTRLKEAEIAQAVELGDVQISDLAVFPREPIRPRKLRSMLLSILLGLTLGLGIAAARDYLDETVHTREDLNRLTGLPVLGLIPRIRGSLNGNGSRAGLLKKDKPVRERLVTRDDISNPVSEAYRAFRTNITFLDLEKPAQVLVFTSPGPSEGKSTSAANLAITLAQQGSKAVLLDCDLRRGIVHRVFGVEKLPGLTNVALGEVELTEAVRTVQVGQERTLDFLPTGTLPPNPSELLGSRKMADIVAALRKEYELVLIDSPPLNVVTDAAVLGTLADGVILIARAGATERGALKFARDQLHAVQAPVSGVVLNDVDFQGRDRYYGTGAGYRYYYRYYRQEA